MPAAITYPTFPGKWATRFVDLYLETDPIFGKQGISSTLARAVSIQPYDHAPDHLFPPAAEKFGMVRYVPAQEDAPALLGARGPKCAQGGRQVTCHSKNHLPAFLYT